MSREIFVRTSTRLRPVPLIPEILVHTAGEATALWAMTEAELGQSGLAPPFWAFPWAGGQALARYVLDHPDLVRGRRVLDVAAGSGLVAIAAARAGAGPVLANDIDRFAHAAIALNADANGVAVAVVPGDLTGTDDGWDVVLAGDMSYERDMATGLTDWLATLAARGATVLIGDPGRTYLAEDKLEALARYDVPVSRDLEDVDVKPSCVWRFRRSALTGRARIDNRIAP